MIKYAGFDLSAKKELKKKEMSYEVIVVDRSESQIECPKKSIPTKAKLWWIRRAKGFYALLFPPGRSMILGFSKKAVPLFNPRMSLLADTGYMGILKIHSRGETPWKKNKKMSLTTEDNQNNRMI